jgi:hypothetical protein
MGAFEELKKIWKKLGITGHVKNFSSKPLWVLETESGRPVARVLSPSFKTPVDVDVDGFKRVDGGAIEPRRPPKIPQSWPLENPPLPLG